MVIESRVRATSPTVMCDTEVHHQRHRVCRVRQLGIQMYVPTILNPGFTHLLRFRFDRCAKKVSKLLDRPVMFLFDTRVGGTGAKVVP